MPHQHTNSFHLKKLASIIAVASFCVSNAYASTTDGTIDATHKYAKGVNANVGKVNFGSTQGNVHVTDAGLTGYAWGENIGWINLAPTNGGVINNGEGVLSGYAWGDTAGWVNFAPNNGGVTINSSGEFSGYAWSQNFGWIIFNCATNNSCGTESFKVVTDWRPASVRNPVTPPQGGGGGGGGGVYTSAASFFYPYPVATSTPAATSTPLPTPTLPTVPVKKDAFTLDLDIGSRGEEVTALQQFLKTQGYFTGDVTGYFGPVTKAGVMLFQSAKGLAPYSGGVDASTRFELNRLVGGTTYILTPKATFTLDLNIGSRGEEVTALQQFLKTQGYFTGDVTGYFGPVTKAAVILFQSAKGLAPYPGNVGPGTRAVLNSLVGGSSSTGTVATLPPVKKLAFTLDLDIDSSGSEVSKLQQLLKDQGYFTGEVTGYYGPLTKAAVILFQSAKGIAPYPGHVGPGTRAALNSLVGQ